MRTAVLAALGAVIAGAPLRGQLPHLLPGDSPWLDVNYPKLFWTPRQGFTAGAYLAFIRPLSFEDADLPPPYTAAIALDGQASTSGSRFLSVDGRFPHALDGWRFVVSLGAARRARENYFGVGNGSVRNGSLVTDAQENYYRARESRTLLRTEVQRHVTGGLRLLAGLHLERWRLDTLPGPSILAADAAAGLDPTIGVPTTDFTVRGGVVFDTRDDEVAANRGVRLEAIHAVSAGGALDYRRTTVSAAGYLPVAWNLVLAARVLGQGMGGTPRLGSYYLVEASDRPLTGLGGGSSHRALPENRFLGRHQLLLNLDVRYHLVNVPRTARLSLLAFLDAGRVFEGRSFSVTTSGLKVGAGVGVFIQLARSGIIGTTIGVGPDGVVLDVGTRWTY